MKVLHCDNHLLAVDKPAGQPVVPDDSGDRSLLDEARDWVGREFRKPGAVFLGVVHRLDRPVSGVVLFARTSKAASRLSEQFRAHSVRKVYHGLVHGGPRAQAGSVEHWLHKDPRTHRVEVVEEGAQGAKLARTRWRVLERGKVSRLELEPLTGRAHQLRVAAFELGHPLLGDLRYGAREPLPDRSIALHALSLEVEHPTLREPRRFEAPPPDRPWWRDGGGIS